jgi:hypothetical protein
LIKTAKLNGVFLYLLFAASMATPSQGAEFTCVGSFRGSWGDGCSGIALTGKIELKDVEKFETFLRQHHIEQGYLCPPAGIPLKA